MKRKRKWFCWEEEEEEEEETFVFSFFFFSFLRGWRESLHETYQKRVRKRRRQKSPRNRFCL